MALDVYAYLLDDDLDAVAERHDQESHQIATRETRAEVIELRKPSWLGETLSRLSESNR